jgi:hypothetical protein
MQKLSSFAIQLPHVLARLVSGCLVLGVVQTYICDEHRGRLPGWHRLLALWDRFEQFDRLTLRKSCSGNARRHIRSTYCGSSCGEQ